jgi:hypothetical protein
LEGKNPLAPLHFISPNPTVKNPHPPHPKKQLLGRRKRKKIKSNPLPLKTPFER